MMQMLRALSPKRLGPIVRFFHPYIRPHAKLMLVAVGVSIVTVVFMVAQPWPLKLVFDYILHYKKQHAQLLPYFDLFSENKTEGMVIICALVLFFSLGRAVTEYYQTLLTNYVGQKVVVDLRAKLFEHLHKLSIGFHTQSRSGDILMRLTGDINLLRELFVGLLITFLSNTLVMVLMIGVMLYLDVRLTLLSLSVVPVLALVVFGFGLRIRQATHRQRRKESEVSVAAHEALIGMRVIQAFNRERSAQKVFERQNRGTFRQGMRAARLEAMSSQLTEIILSVGVVLVLWYGVQDARANPPRGTPGDLILYLFYLRNMYKPIRDFSRLISRAAKATASAERVMEVLRTEPDIADSPDAVPAPRLTGHIVFHDVHFAYKDGTKVLKGIHLEIKPGEKVALVGMSGAGKSTLSSLLLRLYDPTSGNVLIDGQDVRHFTLKSLRRQISLVLQESLLFGTTVFENIAFGRPDATPAQVERAARRAQAHDFIMRMPNGYETLLAERGLSLSEGQKQRIALARAFLKKAPCLSLTSRPRMWMSAASGVSSAPYRS